MQVTKSLVTLRPYIWLITMFYRVLILSLPGQYNQSSGGGGAGPPYSQGGSQQTHSRPGNNYQSSQQHKQYNNRRYPSNFQQLVIIRLY